jgi:alpha/beta hydrolase fold
VAVLDAVGVDRVVAVGVSLGGRHALQLAAWYPDRVAGVVAIGAALPWPLPPDFDAQKPRYEGADKVNSHYWLADYRGWVEFFMSLVFTEPHSTKQREDGVAWGMETSAETLVLTARAADADGGDAAAEAVCRQVRCPVLVVHGQGDLVVPHETGVALARMTGGQLVTISGGGHAPTMRDPVRVNLLIRDFTESLGLRPRPTAAPAAPRAWTRAPRPAQAGAVRQLADRARACAPRPGDRRRAPGQAPGPADRLACPASGHRGAGGARRAGAPGVPRASERELAHRVRGGRA